MPASVKASKKARKKPKNQPVTFSETLAPAPAYAPVADVSFRLSERQQRAGLTIIWVAAMVLIGIAVGWRIVAAQRSAVATPPGRPVAASPVNVAALGYNPSVAEPVPASQAALTVTRAAAVTQAAAGSPFITFSVGTFQPADGPDALQPGFQTELTPQGTVGTNRVN